MDVKLLVGDCGSRDGTIAYCLGLGAQVSRFYDLSEARNDLAKRTQTAWQMYLEPWETILSGQELLRHWLEEGGPTVVRCPVLRDEVVTKEVRIWQRSAGLRFQNPVFEHLPDEGAVHADIWIYSPPQPTNEETSSRVKAWKDRHPTLAEPLYYEACLALASRQNLEFLRLAESYLFVEKNQASMSAIMTRYYMALVQCYVARNGGEAIRNALICLGARPTMAEFWCLVGDIFFQGRQYAKAKNFYESAIAIGERRRQDDAWPMEIAKYLDYPKEMIARCDEIAQKIMSKSLTMTVTSSS